MGGVDIRNFGVNIEFESTSSKENEQGIGEYKRREIFTNAIERETKEREDYKRKLKLGLI